MDKDTFMDTILMARRMQLAADELSNPANAGTYYLSFADEEGFLGGVFVEAHGIITAVEKATEMGLNPGGEVACWGPVPPPIDSSMNRLLSKEEVEASPPKDSAIIDIADERHLHQEDDECGEVNSSIDYGKPCIRFKGHDEYDGQRNHITESGVWWT